MSKSPRNDQYSEEETKRRAEEALRGAFKTPPMPHEATQKKDKRNERK